MSLPCTPEYMDRETSRRDDTWEEDNLDRATSTQNDGCEGKAEGSDTENWNTVSCIDSHSHDPTTVADHIPTERNQSQTTIRDIGMAVEMNACNRKKYGFSRLVRRMMAIRFSNFADEVALVGVYKLALPSDTLASVARKIMWSMLLLFGVGFLAFQVYQRISYYLSWPIVVNYNHVYNSSLRFPTVTFCPENLFSRKAVEAFGGYGRDGAEAITRVFPPFPDAGPQTNYKRFKASSWNVDWETFYVSLAPKHDEILLECKFNNVPCDSTLEAAVTDFGLCYSFNPSKANYVTTQPGAIHGLRLVLWTNQSDMLLTQSPAAGFRMVLHHPSELPILQSVGFRISPGTSTSVSISLKKISQLPPPYGTCRDENNYTFMGCISDCVAHFILDRCKCRPFQTHTSGPVCNPEHYVECVYPMYGYFISSGESRKCDCPLQCFQHEYPYSISASHLSQLFLNYTLRKPIFKGRNLTMSRLRRELVYLEAFYSDLTYTDIQTFPACSILDLFCAIGGALGLILGGSVLTVVQILQLAGQIFDALKVSYTCSGKTSIP